MQKLQLRQLKVMRVGRRLESVMSHWLDAKAILGSKYTTAEVSIDSAPGPPDALTGNDPPRYPHIGVVMDGNGELVVAVQSASNDGFHLGVFHAGESAPIRRRYSRGDAETASPRCLSTALATPVPPCRVGITKGGRCVASPCRRRIEL